MPLPRKTLLASATGLTALGLTLAATGCASGENFCETSQEFLQLNASYLEVTIQVGQSIRNLPTVTQNGPVTSATLVSGNLPAGTSLQRDGGVTGSPTEAGTYLLQVQLANAQGAKLTVPAKITVLPAKELGLTYVTPRTFKLGVGIPTQVPSLTDVMPGWTIAYALTKGSLPPGLTLDPKTGEIKGTPTAPGVSTFEVLATNGSRSALCPPVTYVVEPAQALQVSYDDKTFRQGTLVHDGILLPTLLNATPGLPVTYALTEGSLPPGFSLHPESGSIAGTATTPGIFKFRILATNGSRTATTAMVTYIVEPSADLTVSYSHQTFLQGTTILPGRFMPTLGNALPVLPTTYALASGSLPPGMSLDPATGSISGTATKVGRYTFTIRATNGSRSATTGDVIYIVENASPLGVSYSNRTLLSGTAMTAAQPQVSNITPGLGSSFGLASGTLPPGLRIDSKTGIISGIPTTPGVYTFAVTIANGSREGLSDPVTYTVEYAQALTLGYTIPVLTVGTDIGSKVPAVGPLTPGVTTTYGITGLPLGLNFNTSTGAFTGAPVNAGYYPVTVTVTNGTRTATTTFNIEVVPVGALGLAYTNQTFVVNTAIPNQSPSAQTNFTPGAPTSYSAVGLPAGLSIHPTTGVISGTPQAAAEGIRAFTVTVVNGSRQYTTHVTYTINHEGTLTLGYPSNLSFTTGTSIGNQDPSTVLNVTSGVPVSYASANLPAGLSLDPNTGRITGHAPAPGTYTFQVTLTNGTLPGGGARTAQATVVYLSTYAEAMTLAYATNPVETATGESVGTNNATVTYGTPGTTTTFQVTSLNGVPASALPTGMVLNADGSITGTAGVAPGVYDITITATNGQRNANTTVRYIVTPVALLTVTYADKTLNVGNAVTTGNTPTLGNDTPGLSTTYAAVNPALLPNGLGVNPTSGAITGTASAPGTFTFQIRATNGARTATDTVIYTVNEVAPSTLNYTPVPVSEDVLITPLDPNPTGGTPTTYVLLGSLPTGLSLNATTGQITGTPAVGSAGSYTITVRGSNSAPGSVEQTFTILVVGLPSVSSFEANPTLVPRGSASSLSAFFTGPTGTTATLADDLGHSYGTVLPGSLSTGILNQADGTTITYTLTVSNGLGGVVTKTAQVKVYEPASKLEIPLAPGTPATGEVEDNASPLDGVKVDIPGVAICSNNTLMVIPETLAAAGLSGKLPGNGETVISPVYNLTVSEGYPFRAPITVSLPYDATAEAGLGATDLVVPFYWEPTYQKWVAVGLKGYSTYSATGPVTRNRVTFTTLLPGRYILLAYKGLIPATLAPTFSMASDTLSLGNQGEYENPGGSSLGISAFQAWYQSMRKATNGNAGLKTLIPANAAIQAPLASRLAGGSLSSWNQLYSQSSYTLTVNQTARALITGLKATGQPQLFLMKGERSGTTYTAVAMLVTGYNSATGTFNVVDPNFPSDDLTLNWNSAGSGTFTNYSREIVYSPAPSAWAFEGQPSVHRLSDYEILLDGMKSTPRWKNPPFAQITADAVTDTNSPTGSSAVPDGGTVTVNSYPNPFSASISGTVLDGDQTANYILSSQNGGLRSPSALSAGAFTLNPFTLTNPYGTTVMLETAPNACDPTFTHSGFMSFTAKQDQLPDFFKNLCFENNNTSSWTLSSRVQTNNSTYAGTDRTPTPVDWTVVVNAGADTNSGTLNLPKVLSGSKALRVNTNRTGGDLSLSGAPASKVVQQVQIPDVAGADPKLEFYWAACMQDPNHDPWEQPYVTIVVEITAGANAGLKFIDRHFVAGDSYTGWKTVSSTDWRVIPWQKVSVAGLKAYKGQTVRLTVEAAGCTLGGHAGYAYLDALKCE